MRGQGVAAWKSSCFKQPMGDLEPGSSSPRRLLIGRDLVFRPLHPLCSSLSCESWAPCVWSRELTGQ